MPEILPIMPALCSMLFDANYAPTYAGIISLSLYHIGYAFQKVVKSISIPSQLVVKAWITRDAWAIIRIIIWHPLPVGHQCMYATTAILIICTL